MTWWCPDFNPNEDEQECNGFKYDIDAWELVDESDNQLDGGQHGRTDDDPVCDLHGNREARWLNDTELIGTRAQAYENAGWGWCMDDEEWERDPCTRDTDTLIVTAPLMDATMYRPGDVIALNRGEHVAFNVLTQRYEKVRPIPKTTRTAWAD